MAEFLSSEEFHALQKIVESSKTQGCGIWVVGGVIRDALLGQPQRLADIDLVVEGDSGLLATRLAKEFSAEKKIFPNFLTAKVIGIPAIGELDLASARRESYKAPGALPEVFAASLAEDSRRRDFTVNTLYVELSDFISCSSKELRAKVKDPVGGLSDLDARLTRTLHKKSFLDDPTRLFRALRYNYKIGGTLESLTLAQFEEAIICEALTSISKQRVLNEIRRTCEEKDWANVLLEFCRRGLLTAAELLSKHQLSQFEAAFAVAPNLNKFEDRFDLFIGFLYSISEANIRQSSFRSLGFGKKFFKRFDKILETREVVEDAVAAELLVLNAKIEC